VEGGGREGAAKRSRRRRRAERSWSCERLTSRAEVSSAGCPRFLRPDCDANCVWRIATQENLHRSRWSSRSHRGATWRRRQMCERWRSNGSPARTGRRERCERRIVVVFSRHTRRRDGCCALRVISRTGAETPGEGRRGFTDAARPAHRAHAPRKGASASSICSARRLSTQVMAVSSWKRALSANHDSPRRFRQLCREPEESTSGKSSSTRAQASSSRLG
jgi:hypothetical protein